jgi:LmbE family N-acetylglucosaminyl deacetylase
MQAAVIVAHPDDETLWCGGFVLQHPDWQWSVVTLCRGSDTDRAPRFRRVINRLAAHGAMDDLDDGPEQHPLPAETVQQSIADLLPNVRFDLVLTHGPRGEYTRHLRHEECCRAVVALWAAGRLRAAELWLFAYEDSAGEYLPRVQSTADKQFELSDQTWREKQRLITDVYGFSVDSWEARVTPRVEGFHCFHRPIEATEFVAASENQR